MTLSEDIAHARVLLDVYLASEARSLERFHEATYQLKACRDAVTQQKQVLRELGVDVPDTLTNPASNFPTFSTHLDTGE